MTVDELIKKLQTFDPDSQVILRTPGSGPISAQAVDRCNVLIDDGAAYWAHAEHDLTKTFKAVRIS